MDAALADAPDVMFAVCTVVIGVALGTVILAVVYGLASPTRTPASCLRALALTVRQAVVEVDALRPQGQNKGSL